MHEEAKEFFICPKTGQALELKDGTMSDGHVAEGSLATGAPDGQQYPIVNGVPRFVEWEGMESDQKDTVDAFAYKWTQIKTYAFEEKTKRNREQWFFDRFGFENGDSDVKEFLAPYGTALEAGTGTGVDTDMLARNFEGKVYGIDISSAIDTAFDRFKGRHNIHLAQADIGCLPFRPESFGVIVCDQVLHHTPEPRQNFTKLVKLLAPGGRMLLYLYKVKAPIREFCDDHLRDIHTHSSLEECLDFCRKMTRLGKMLSDLNVNINIEDDIPELGLEKGEHNLQRTIYNHFFKCFWNDDYDFDTNVMINFDWYRPTHAFRYSKEELLAWCEAEQVVVERCHECPSGISLIVHKQG